MTEKLGHVALERDRRSYLTPNELAGGPHERDFSEATAAAIDKEVRRIVDEAFDRAITILTERRDLLERTARRLLEKETLDEADLRVLIKEAKVPVGSEAAE